eukprot:Em0964g4a
MTLKTNTGSMAILSRLPTQCRAIHCTKHTGSHGESMLLEASLWKWSVRMGPWGLDPRNVELIWDQMFKGTLELRKKRPSNVCDGMEGRGGGVGKEGEEMSQAISAVDLALWDALGKIRREPVYALLGGKTRGMVGNQSMPSWEQDQGMVGNQSMPSWGARPGYGREPVYALLGVKTRVWKGTSLCRNMALWRPRYPVPLAPPMGTRDWPRTCEIFRGFRSRLDQTLPTDVSSRLDCYMALSVSYATRLANALQPYNLKWIEECMPPDDYIGYSELHRNLAGSCLLTTGEHEYTRAGSLAAPVIDSSCPSPLLPPPMLDMASGCCLNRVRLPQPGPLAEYINLSPQADKIVPYFGGLFTDEPLPENGFVTLPDRPGFGVTLNRDSLHRPYPRPAATKMQTKCSESTDVAKMPL